MGRSTTKSPNLSNVVLRVLSMCLSSRRPMNLPHSQVCLVKSLDHHVELSTLPLSRISISCARCRHSEREPLHQPRGPWEEVRNSLLCCAYKVRPWICPALALFRAYFSTHVGFLLRTLGLWKMGETYISPPRARHLAIVYPQSQTARLNAPFQRGIFYGLRLSSLCLVLPLEYFTCSGPHACPY